MSPPVTRSPDQPERPTRKRSSGIVTPHSPRWHQRLGAWLVFIIVRMVSATVRYRWHDRSGRFLESHTGPAIYCVWHNRLALCMPIYYGYIHKHTRAQGLAALVSASKDGGFLAAILRCFRVQPVRGSSSRRGAQALLELTTWSERGYDLAITPDGPRGPRYVVQEGIMSLAQVTGFPVVPISYNLNRKIAVHSWDRFLIPLPFSTCDAAIGQPVRVPREASPEERQGLRRQLESTLREMSRD
ncbi:MAG TPA: lysophospholipid acyltransferase family protein [Clostridia bacterium]|nr:lysophospholipid acyltransferase family protein [Clostridia bacterium]